MSAIDLGLLKNIKETNADVILRDITKVNRGHVGVFNSCFLPELYITTMEYNLFTGCYNFDIKLNDITLSFINCKLERVPSDITKPCVYKSNDYHVKVKK